ncbi:MAG: class I poly(R)-hydroxyalkanoic acid synthase [Proteobacteria bacterium]|nr:class I poly(R)-hydroxyalkanoic acid synthase [Burkholderiales bacterium]
MSESKSGDTAAAPASGPTHDAAAQAPDMARQFNELAQRSSHLVTQFLERTAQHPGAMPSDEMGVGRAFTEAFQKMWSDPMKLAQSQMNMWGDYVNLWQSTWMKSMGMAVAPIAEAEKGDKRFKHDDWESNLVFNYLKQSYLIAARHTHGAMTGVEGLDVNTRKKVDFFTRQYIDAMAPTNFALTNPEVLRETVDSGGQNLLNGLDNLLDDLERGGGTGLRISMTDRTQFKLGENIALTPGKVVHQTTLMQLIQYAPSTEKVLKRPLLIVPPWINKFYILDLREKNSFIKWAVDQGHTVFVVSWVNPDERLADQGFEDYLRLGPLAALDALRAITGEPDANVIGYCLGGTLLASALAWLKAKGEASRVASATFFTAMIDFADPGELGVFIDEEQLDHMERKMAKRGYLEGHEMATTFNLMRANDLIWSFVVNNYLMGRDPFPFDLLYWNADSTRMPAAMHGFYLRNMYLKNLLRTPGGITLDGVPIDVTTIETPAYFLSTMEDHIAPWKSTYAGAALLRGPVQFTLAGSGHIAGVINPPAAKKYQHWTSTAPVSLAPDAWLAQATPTEGSWWPHWHQWVSTGFGNGEVDARVPGSESHPPLEDAPGSYVRQGTDAAVTAVETEQEANGEQRGQGAEPGRSA